MPRTFFDRVADYRFDPFFPTALPLAVFFALRDIILNKENV